MRSSIITLASFLTTIRALTITSPASGSIVDPSQPILIQWTFLPTDPANFNLVLVNSADSAFTFNGNPNVPLAQNVPTAQGSYTVPANTFSQFGAGYVIRAQSGSGDSLATSNSFILGYGANQVVTLSNGQLSLAPVPTGSSIIFNTAGISGQSVTASYLPSTSYSTSFSNGTPVGPTATGASSLVFTTDGVTGSMTIMTSSSARTASSSSGSVRSTAASASTAVASATNAQPKVSAGKEVMGIAGLLAGLAALIV